ncbi:MAG: M1 family aminopeptidase [Myxococcota bacterium]
MACIGHGWEASTERLPFAEPGVGPTYAPDRVVRITHLELRLVVHPEAHRFSGTALISLEALPTFRGEFGFDLDDVTLEAVTDDAGNPLTAAYVDGQVRIKADEVPRQVRIRWAGDRPRRGLFFTGPSEAHPQREPMAWTQCQDEDGHFVFPCHDHPSTKHPWTIEVVAPKGYTLLSNGQLVDEGEVTEDALEMAWARYEQPEPMPAYLVTVVAAKLSVIETDWRGRPVRYYVPTGREENVERAFSRTPEMIEHFSTRLGVDYPWPRYDQVVVDDFIFGGMENVACTTMTDALLVDEKAAVEWQPDSLVSHELAHQWFGDLVTCQDWSQGWLNESWATFLEAVWWEHTRPTAEATWYRWQTAAGYLAEHHSRYRRPIVSYDFREPIDVFDRHLYNKGSCVLWTLRTKLGPDAFWTGVQSYLTRHANSTAHTRHFQRAIEDATGTNLDGFFAQWIFETGHPMATVTVGREHDGHRITVKQSGDAKSFELVVEVQDGDDAREVKLHVDSAKQTFVVPGSSEAHLRIDPGYRGLAELKLRGPDQWLERLLLDACPVMAVRAGKALLARDGRRHREAVRNAMETHPFWGVRGALATALAKAGTDSIRDHLRERLLAETDPRAQRAIAQALGRWRNSEVADTLVELLDRNDLPSWHLEAAALKSLAKTRDDRAEAVIRGRLGQKGWTSFVWRAALIALGELDGDGILETLMAHTRNTVPDLVRMSAATALGSLGDRGDATERREIVDRLVEMLKEPGFRSQLAAIGALAKMRDSAALEGLGEIHRTAPDGRTRRMAYEAMARIRRGRTTEAGLSALRDQVTALSEANAQLRERIDRLERTDDA